MALLLKEFGWNWVAVVGSEEEYGQQGVKQFSKLAENMSICVAYEGLIPVYSDPEPVVKTIVNNIIATKVGVVVVFSVVDPAVVFFEEVSNTAKHQCGTACYTHNYFMLLMQSNLFQVIRRNLTGVWIASTSWTVHHRITSIPNIKSIGTILGFTDLIGDVGQLTAYAEALFIKLSADRERTSHPPAKPGNPDNPCSQCENLSLANISLVTDQAVQRTAFSVYAAVYSVAEALHKLLGCNSTACMWGSESKVYPWKVSCFFFFFV